VWKSGVAEFSAWQNLSTTPSAVFVSGNEVLVAFIVGNGVFGAFVLDNDVLAVFTVLDVLFVLEFLTFNENT
jgi:hypothetical protein